MPETGEGQFRGSEAATDRRSPLDQLDIEPRTGERDRSGEAVRAGANDDGVDHR
jgi:hypothetical protein